MGHSNGTYLLAQALLACPAIKMDRVVFAGSVVRADHDWQTLMTASRPGAKPQVGGVLIRRALTRP